MRRLFLPLSLIYGLISEVRNFLFDQNILKSYKSEIFTIVVGGLNSGGSGKTPMVKFLTSKLQNQYKTVILSRGYARKSKGLVVASNESTIEMIGDEPFMLFHFFGGKIPVICSENRVEGIKWIQENLMSANVVVCDDGFQHRWLKPQLSILLTPASKPFTKDFVLPLGTLRELPKNAQRADILVVTKSTNHKINIIHPTIFYAKSVSTSNYSVKNTNEEALFVCGLANEKMFLDEMKSHFLIIKEFIFKDHHWFTKLEIDKILNFGSQKIVTTTKDWVKIKNYVNQAEAERFIIFDSTPFFDLESEFLTLINTKIDDFYSK